MQLILPTKQGAQAQHKYVNLFPKGVPYLHEVGGPMSSYLVSRNLVRTQGVKHLLQLTYLVAAVISECTATVSARQPKDRVEIRESPDVCGMALKHFQSWS